MKTCPYCATVLKYSVCGFCGYQGEGNENGVRSNQSKIHNFFSLERATQPLSILEKCHTHDLLFGLKLLRAERSASYEVLKSVNNLKVHLGDDPEYKKTKAEAGEAYEYWTRKAWIIENILMDRMGYYPERVEDEMLDRVKELSKKDTANTMGFYKKKTQNTK